MSDRDDRMYDDLLRAVPPEGGGAGACPDDNVLNSFIEGTLAEDRRPDVESHIAACAACQALVAAVDEAVRDVSSAPAGRRLPLWSLAVAALLLAGVVVGAIVFTQGGGEQPGMEVQLASATERLRSKHPSLFGDFLLLNATERAADPGLGRRGGVVQHRPAGVLLGGRPEFTWVPVKGAADHELAVFDDGMNRIWGVTTGRKKLAWHPELDPLPPRNYIWRVRAQGVLGAVEGRQSFTVADNELAGRFAAARRAAQAEAGEAAELLLAQWAWRADLRIEAERLLQAHLARHPDEPIANEMLGLVRRSFRE